MSSRGQRSLPVYPILVALSFLLAAFFDADISPYAASRAFGIVILAVMVLTVMAVLTLGRLRGGMAVAVLILIARTGDTTHALVAIGLVIALTAAWLLGRRMWPSAQVLLEPTAMLNAFAAILLAVTVGGAVANGAFGRLDFNNPAEPEGLHARPEGAARDKPDIYVILLDGYPRADTLTRLFDYDNAPFLDKLRSEGFDVARGSRSNYMYTELTLPSLLHMQYVQDIPNLRATSVPFGTSTRYDINHNPVWADLRSKGYVVAATKPPWENVAMRGADVFCGDAPNDFELFLLRTTLAGHVFMALDPSFEADAYRAAVDDAFTCLDRLDEATVEPKFVFVHVGSPHLPIVFAADGAAADPSLFGHTADDVQTSRAGYLAGYVGQVEFLNQRVAAATNRLANRADEPIVIVMSDHGSESRLDWANALNSDMAERFSNLFAARAAAFTGLFKCDMTPVEVFPAIFSKYFHETIAAPEPRFFAAPKQDVLDLTEIDDPAGTC